MALETSPLRPKRNQKRCKQTLIMTVAFLAALAILLLLQETGVFPGTIRGFFCNDDSLKYPYKNSTVPTWLLITVFWGIPHVVFLVAELILRRELIVLYYSAVIFNYNIFGCLLVTNLIKLSVGRLRPHFFYACGPDVLQNVSCASLGPETYITNYTCTNPHELPDNKIADVHLSFPSGHASMAVAAGAFLFIYVWRRFESGPPHFVRMLVFVLTVAATLFVAVTRVMDYKHFASDVVSGGVLGAAFALFSGLVWWKSMNAWEEQRQGFDDDSTAPLREATEDTDSDPRGTFTHDSPLRNIEEDEKLP